MAKNLPLGHIKEESDKSDRLNTYCFTSKKTGYIRDIRSKMPLNILSKPIGVKIQNGINTRYMFENGLETSSERLISLIENHLIIIEGVFIATRENTKYLKTHQDYSKDNNLDNLPQY